MSVMKIAGKNPSNVVKGILVDADGNMITKKKWENEIIQIYSDGTSPESGTHRCTEVDVSDAGAVSLRVNNGTDVDINLGLYVDFSSGHYYMRDAQGGLMMITVEAGKECVLISPDDFPALQWISNLRVFFTNSTSATSGAVSMYAVIKR